MMLQINEPVLFLTSRPRHVPACSGEDPGVRGLRHPVRLRGALRLRVHRGVSGGMLPPLCCAHSPCLSGFLTPSALHVRHSAQTESFASAKVSLAAVSAEQRFSAAVSVSVPAST